jgi:hypothetical protein
MSHVESGLALLDFQGDPSSPDRVEAKAYSYDTIGRPNLTVSTVAASPHTLLHRKGALFAMLEASRMQQTQRDPTQQDCLEFLAELERGRQGQHNLQIEF